MKEKVMNGFIPYVLILPSRGYLETKWSKNWMESESKLLAASINFYKHHCYLAEALSLDLDWNSTHFALSTRFPNKSLIRSKLLLGMLGMRLLDSALICMCESQKL